ncbi:hypothetical protein RQP46_006064 [Phenoliferia psychrophenolica]
MTTPLVPAGPFTLEQRLQRMEAELAAVRRVTDLHSARFQMIPAAGNPLLNGGGGNGSGGSPFSMVDMDEVPPISMEDPLIDILARTAFEQFWTDFAPWAPYISSTTDTYDQLRQRSPLLLFCILAVTSRFQHDARFSAFCEERALDYMRNTLYTPEAPTLDDLKGTIVYNAWMSRGAPPGHSMTLAAQLDLPGKFRTLLASVTLPPTEAAQAFDSLMPAARTWLALYAQDLWLSVGTGRRSMVTVDFSMNTARNLLTFTALRPVDARIIAQCELLNIMSGVQEAFVKVQKHSIADTVRIVMSAVDHLDLWMKTWEDWARRQEESTTAYMTASFQMALFAGKFYITTLGLRDIQSPDEVTAEQLPVVKASIHAATEIQYVAVTYGPDRMSHATEFTLISLSSAALFLLKMIKLLPTAVPSIPQALLAVRNAAALLAGAPVKQYHRAVVGALAHLESTLDLSHPETPTSGIDPNALGVESMLFDPEMELAIASVLQSDDFWSWQQSLPADNFAGILS